MNKLPRIIIPLIIIALIAGIVVWRIRSANTGPANTLVGNGVVEATEVDVSSQVSGKITTLSVHEGDSVTAGQLIALLDDGVQVGQMEQAVAAVSGAEAQIEAARQNQKQVQARLSLVEDGPRAEDIAGLRAQVGQAQAVLDNAKDDVNRLQQLYDNGAISQKQLVQAQKAREADAQQVAGAKTKLDAALAGARPQELAEARAAAAAAEAQVTTAEKQRDQALGVLKSATEIQGQTRIVAPSDGKVTLRNVEPGELVTPGQPIIRIADMKQVWTRVYVPEMKIGQLKLGQHATVVTDAFPNRQFTGIVSEIAETPEFTPKNVQTKDERVKLVFGVKIALDNPQMELKPGMPADASINIKE